MTCWLTPCQGARPSAGSVGRWCVGVSVPLGAWSHGSVEMTWPPSTTWLGQGRLAACCTDVCRGCFRGPLDSGRPRQLWRLTSGLSGRFPEETGPRPVGRREVPPLCANPQDRMDGQDQAGRGHPPSPGAGAPSSPGQGLDPEPLPAPQGPRASGSAWESPTTARVLSLGPAPHVLLGLWLQTAGGEASQPPGPQEPSPRQPLPPAACCVCL